MVEKPASRSPGTGQATGRPTASRFLPRCDAFAQFRHREAVVTAVDVVLVVAEDAGELCRHERAASVTVGHRSVGVGAWSWVKEPVSSGIRVMLLECH